MVVLKTDLTAFDKCILKYLRVLLRGDACDKILNSEGIATSYRSISSKEVWTRCKMVPCGFELRIRRLKLLQGIVSDPRNRTMLLAAVLGKLTSEAHPAVLSAGKLHPDANLWAVQLDGLRVVEQRMDLWYLFGCDFNKLFGD